MEFSLRGGKKRGLFFHFLRGGGRKKKVSDFSEKGKGGDDLRGGGGGKEKSLISSSILLGKGGVGINYFLMKKRQRWEGISYLPERKGRRRSLFIISTSEKVRWMQQFWGGRRS